MNLCVKRGEEGMVLCHTLNYHHHHKTIFPYNKTSHLSHNIPPPHSLFSTDYVVLSRRVLLSSLCTRQKTILNYTGLLFLPFARFLCVSLPSVNWDFLWVEAHCSLLLVEWECEKAREPSWRQWWWWWQEAIKTRNTLFSSFPEYESYAWH